MRTPKQLVGTWGAAYTYHSTIDLDLYLRYLNNDLKAATLKDEPLHLITANINRIRAEQDILLDARLELMRA